MAPARCHLLTKLTASSAAKQTVRQLVICTATLVTGTAAAVDHHHHHLYTHSLIVKHAVQGCTVFLVCFW